MFDNGKTSGWRKAVGVAVTAGSLVVAGAGVASADDITNDLPASIDSTVEVMPLTVGGSTGSTTLSVIPENGDGKNGCNLTSNTTLTLSITSSNPAVAPVDPASVTFASCGATPQLTVTPVGPGTTTITAAVISNTTAASFNLDPATFTVNVTPQTPTDTPPQVSVHGVTDGATYNAGSVPAATCTVTDAEDGDSSFPAALSAVTGPDAVDGIGEQSAGCDYTDGGGLESRSSVTYSIVDPSAPVITYTLDPASPDGTNNWYTGDVSLTWHVFEPESPNSVQTTGCGEQHITADQAATTYTCDASSAGGTATQGSVTIKRDGTAPSVTGQVTSAPIDVAGTTWYADSAHIDWSATDPAPGSGVATGADPASSDLGEGYGQSARSSATDNAGNTGTGQVTGINVDAAAPTTTITCPGDVVQGSSASGSWTASDEDGGSGLAGPASGTVPLDTSAIGAHTATGPDASDNVGHNTPGKTCHYTVDYNWSGFFQPIDNSDVFNVAKAGSAIPVKFSLHGNQGLSIFGDGSPSATKVSCDPSSSTDAVEQLAGTTSGLKYDATADQYNYTWKTSSGYAGTCQRLTLNLVDGTTHTALFKFTK